MPNGITTITEDHFVTFIIIITKADVAAAFFVDVVGTDPNRLKDQAIIVNGTDNLGFVFCCFGDGNWLVLDLNVIVSVVDAGVYSFSANVFDYFALFFYLSIVWFFSIVLTFSIAETGRFFNRKCISWVFLVLVLSIDDSFLKVKLLIVLYILHIILTSEADFVCLKVRIDLLNI